MGLSPSSKADPEDEEEVAILSTDNLLQQMAASLHGMDKFIVDDDVTVAFLGSKHETPFNWDARAPRRKDKNVKKGALVELKRQRAAKQTK